MPWTEALMMHLDFIQVPRSLLSTPFCMTCSALQSNCHAAPRPGLWPDQTSGAGYPHSGYTHVILCLHQQGLPGPANARWDKIHRLIVFSTDKWKTTHILRSWKGLYQLHIICEENTASDAAFLELRDNTLEGREHMLFPSWSQSRFQGTVMD
jgi:hypothetical protein